jgi:hypothetical protein
MVRLFVTAALLVAAATSAFARELNKSAAASSSTSVSQSHSGKAANSRG